MRIRVLPDTVINQIAAGEVVDRPGSVVRELVDNAVDAGAEDIFVSLEGGGHSRIRVRDSGCGMSKDDAILAFERHATSKVSSLNDLVDLSTLGFRGEALASIAAVSKVQMRTRARDSEVGTLVVFRGGKLTDVQSIAWNQGTEIEVEHLFFNTPARRKFLKSPRAEVSRIKTWLAYSGLARPGVRYRLVSDGDEILHLAPVGTIAERAVSVFGSDLIPVSLSEGGVNVEGMISHPGQALGDQSGFVILVNTRLVTDKIIMRAIREGYDSMLKDREYPVGYLSITLAGEDVDINVHPQKSEVRLRHAQQVFAVVRGAVLAGVRSIRRPLGGGNEGVTARIGTDSSATPIKREQENSVYDRWALREPSVVAESSYRPQALFSTHDRVAQMVVQESAPLSTQYAAPKRPEEASIGLQRTEVSLFRFSDLRFIGQLLSCYLVCEHGDKLVVIDMHAAHERINYNRVRSLYAKRSKATQKVLIPERIKLTDEQVTHLLEQVELLHDLGFEIEQVGSDTIVVGGVPAAVAHLNCAALLRECAAEPLSSGWRERVEERVDHIAARIACHASVRSGDQLSRQEVYALLAQLDDCELSGACPHGRPVVAQFHRDAVERWFGRDR